MKNKKDNLPYSLKSIQIENFKGIKKTALNNIKRNTPWIFLTGRNGYGKTCFLQAIMIAIMGNHSKNQLIENDDFIIKIKGYTPELEFEDTIEGPGPKRDVIKFPILGYGSSRLSIQADTSSNEEKGKSSVHYNLFFPDGVLLNIENELKNWFYRSRTKEINPNTGEKLNLKYKSVRKILLTLLPNLEDIRIDPETDKVEYYEKDGEGNKIEEARSFQELASGNRSIIAMIGDMIIRFFRVQMQVADPSDLEGIVIIDELDLHLHPDWQYEFPGLLSKVFPKIQFIGSTHSPIPLLGAPKGSIITTVDRSEDKGITIKKLDIDIKNLTPNLILSSEVFGFHNIIAKSNESQSEIHTEETMQEKDFREELKKRLKKFAEQGGDYPDDIFKK